MSSLIQATKMNRGLIFQSFLIQLPVDPEIGLRVLLGFLYPYLLGCDGTGVTRRSHAESGR